MLNQALDIHYEIMVKQEQISAIQDSIMSLSVPLDQEKVTMTADPSYMQTVIAQQMQFENELKEDIVRLTVVKQKIVKIINQIDNVKARLVLSKHYLGLKPWNVIAKEMGISQLINSAGRSNSHNSYMNGNAFEALVGAIYLDRGYAACMRFMERRILSQLINIDKVAYKEVNFKSKLLEWSQKNRVQMEFRDLEQTRDENNSPVFTTQVFIEGLEGSKGVGYSKKEREMGRRVMNFFDKLK